MVGKTQGLSDSDHQKQAQLAAQQVQQAKAGRQAGCMVGLRQVVDLATSPLAFIARIIISFYRFLLNSLGKEKGGEAQPTDTGSQLQFSVRKVPSSGQPVAPVKKREVEGVYTLEGTDEFEAELKKYRAESLVRTTPDGYSVLHAMGIKDFFQGKKVGRKWGLVQEAFEEYIRKFALEAQEKVSIVLEKFIDKITPAQLCNALKQIDGQKGAKKETDMLEVEVKTDEPKYGFRRRVVMSCETLLEQLLKVADESEIRDSADCPIDQRDKERLHLQRPVFQEILSDLERSDLEREGCPLWREKLKKFVACRRDLKSVPPKLDLLALSQIIGEPVCYLTRLCEDEDGVRYVWHQYTEDGRIEFTSVDQTSEQCIKGLGTSFLCQYKGEAHFDCATVGWASMVCALLDECNPQEFDVKQIVGGETVR